MSIIDTIKSKAKAALDAVTGNAAAVTLTTSGKLAAGETIDVTLTVTSTGNALESKAAYVDLHGEDDADETLLEKGREFVLGDRDPSHTFDVHGPFSLAAGETKTLTGKFMVPSDLDPKRKWFIRGRVQAIGNDPNSPFAPIS